MKLVSVYTTVGADAILYRLLSERSGEASVSHDKMPSWEEHRAFVNRGFPFMLWYLLRNDGGEYVGALECTDRNEIGISIFREFWRQGYATQALAEFLRWHAPLPGVPAVRNRRWIAHVAPDNDTGAAFWTRAGFRKIQETYAL